jgi:hypothetical protein
MTELQRVLSTLPVTERMAELAISILEEHGPHGLQQVAALIALARIMAARMGEHDRVLLAAEMVHAARALHPTIGIDGAVWN